MFFVQRDFSDSDKTYTRRVGRMTKSYDVAKRMAARCNGYIVNEHRKMVGQCMDSGAPLYVGKLNIGSGEDAMEYYHA